MAIMETRISQQPKTLSELKASGWQSKTVKQELHDNVLRKLADKDAMFPGIVGYDNTVIPEIVIAILAQHDLLFLGEKYAAGSIP